MKIWVKSLIGSLLALLGFQACNPFTIFEGRKEYGCPTANYTFNGEASDESGNPIPGIRIVVAPRGEEDEYSERDTLYTGENGKVEQNLRYSWPKTEGIVVKFEDVDGEANGSFEETKLSGKDVSVKQISKGDGNWYHGAYTITAKAVMKNKDTE